MNNSLRLTVITLLLAASSLPAATLYVSLESTNPTPPYTNWVTAATNIQDAVDAATSGDTVVVTNGSYLGGVVVTNPLMLLSVNGPQFTVIYGGGGTRCVVLTSASLSGFTLTGGADTDGNGGGGVYGGTLSNCTLYGNSADHGGGAAFSTLNNCRLTDNSAPSGWGYWSGFGGGAFGCGLSNCVLTANSADFGGGAAFSTLNNCTLTGNSGSLWGGGAVQCGLNNCTLSGNSAKGGGGADGFGDAEHVLYDCTLSGNRAGLGGGGANGCTLYNCTLTGNGASFGGGALSSTLYNCTLSGNSVGGPVPGTGGAQESTLYNCIVYNNTGGNYGGGYMTLSYCCTTPFPTNGVGNITNAPLFVDYANGNLRLQSNSPCINAGNSAYVMTATDLDGNPRIVSGTLDIGAYEYQGTGSVISYAWLQQYGLPTDGSADFLDPDHDGRDNWQEWVCGTNPTNALSVLRLLSPSTTSTNATVTWQSVAGVSYFLERSTNLAAPFMLLATNIVGQAGTTSYAGKGVNP